jgi:hypothetical protein
MTFVSVLLYSGTFASAQETPLPQQQDSTQFHELKDKYVNPVSGFEIDLPRG